MMGAGQGQCLQHAPGPAYTWYSQCARIRSEFCVSNMLLTLYIPGISGVLGVGQSCVSNMLVILYIPGISGVLGVGQSCVTPTCSRCYIYIPGIPGVLGEGQGCVSPTCSRCFGIPGVLGEGQGCVSPTCSRCYVYTWYSWCVRRRSGLCVSNMLQVLYIYIPGIPEMEFKEFEPRFKSAKPGLN